LSINNTHIYHKDYTEILVTNSNDITFLKKVLIDSEDVTKVGKIRVNKSTGYAYKCGTGENIAHIIMNHTINKYTVVDHKNGDRCDHRKKHLRILTQADNTNNRNKSKSNIGITGIALRTKGNYKYYRATVSDRITPIRGKTKSATKRYCKQFNINKLGEAEALIQAKNWLWDKRKEFGYID